MENIILTIVGIGMMLLAVMLPKLQKNAASDEEKSQLRGKLAMWLGALFLIACFAALAFRWVATGNF